MTKKITQLVLLIFTLSSAIVNAQWHQTTLNNKTIVSMTANSAGVFAGSYSDGVYRSTDDGVTWTQVNNGLNNLTIWGLAVSGDTLYAGTGMGAYRSTDNGDNWTDISNGLAGIYALYDFVFVGSDILVGTLNSVFKSTDHAASWNYSGSGIVSASSSIQSLVGNGTSLFAGSYNLGSVYYSGDTGVTWNSVGLSTYPIRSMGINGSNLFVGTSDTIFYSSDNGATWTSRPDGISVLNKWTLCFAFDGNKVIAGTRGGGVYISDDNGLNWTFKGTGLPAGSYVNKLVISGNNIFAGTDYQQGVWKRTLTEVTTSLEEVNDQADFDIYPNPASDKLIITAKNLNENSHYMVTDITGRKIISVPVQRGSTNSVQVDISSLDAGTYILTGQGPASSSKMFVIQR